MGPGRRFAVVVAGGDFDGSAAALVKKASLIVAADRGALFLTRHNILPHVVVGDFDSCDLSEVEALRAKGSRVFGLHRDKDETDTEVALDMVVNEGFDRAILLGALGGPRVEHGLANVFLLERYAKKGMDVNIWAGATRISWAAGYEYPHWRSRVIHGSRGDFVSLIPISETVRGVTTAGLRFPLSNAVLRRGSTLGISNELLGLEALVCVEQGFLLVVTTGRSP